MKKEQQSQVYTFIDNSNLWIEAKRTARVQFAYDPDQVFRLRIDYGKLLNVICEGRVVGGTVLVGSRPPKADSLWATLKARGIEPRIFDRSVHTGREKGVDAEMVNAIRDTLEDHSNPEVVALVAGDGDYVSTLERCVKRSWRVELYFWSNAARSLRTLPGVRFIELDQFLPQVSFLAAERPLGGSGLVGEDVEAAYGVEEPA